MPRFVLITIAHVKYISGLRCIVAPLREGGAIYRPNARTPGEGASALTGGRVVAARMFAGLVPRARAAADAPPVPPARDSAFDLAGRNERRSSVVRHKIAEPLGRHLDLGEQGQPRCGPGWSTAGEHGH